MGIVQEKHNNRQQRKATKPQSAKPQGRTAKGVAAELSDEALHNLTGYLDVLIQMDFAQKQKQRNERNDEDDNDFQDTTKVDAKVDWLAYDRLVMGKQAREAA